MFEKEAEELEKKAKEYAKDVYYGAYVDEEAGMEIAEDAYIEGAEFGYNKAKEEMQEQGLALQSDMDKTIEQNIALKKQIEKMKLCQNCKFEDNDFMEEPCCNCNRCLGEDIKREGDSDKWEIKEK